MENRRRQWFVLGAATAALVVATTGAAAQELSAGYQFQHLSSLGPSGDSINAPAGFNIDVTFPIIKHLEAVGQIDWSRKTESTTAFGATTDTMANYTTFGGGVRWRGAAGRKATPYVQVLAGRMHSGYSSTATAGGTQASGTSSESDAIVQVGGGMAVRVGGHGSMVGQVDYRHIFAIGQGPSGVSSVRIVVGMRFGL